MWTTSSSVKIGNSLLPSSQENIEEIAGNMLRRFAGRAKRIEVAVTFDETAVKKIAKEGYDPIYGARPLRRAITSQIEDLLSERMLEGSIKAGDHVKLAVQDDAFVFLKDKLAKK